MITTLFALALAAPPTPCPDYEANETSLLYDLGVQPSSLTGYTDGQVVAGLATDLQNPDYTRIAVVRTLLWSNTFAFRLDATGNVPDSAGTWRVGTVGQGKDALTVVHWQDIDDQSWTVYFDDDGACAVTYEN